MMLSIFFNNHKISIVTREAARPGDRLQSESIKVDGLAPGDAPRKGGTNGASGVPTSDSEKMGCSSQRRENGLKSNFARSGDAIATSKRALRQKKKKKF